MRGFEQILVPVDYSEASDGALRMAAALARASNGRLLVLHLLRFNVYGMAELPLGPPAVDGFELDSERARLQTHVTHILEQGDGPPPAYEVEVAWGSPYQEIVELAVDRRVDLIVMGTHGRTGLKHAVLGSVAEKTVRLAPCPVLTVRPQAESRFAAPPAAGEEAPAHRERRGEVGRLMSVRPVTIGPDAMLADALGRMQQARTRHLPVVDGARLVGMLSDRDIPAHTGQLERTHVHVAMTPSPATVSADVGADTAARPMLEHRVRALPVVEGETVVGMLSTSDILEDYVRAARR